MTRSEPCLLSVRDLVVRYRASRTSEPALTAVRCVSLDIQAGGIYGLVGESGSGKSSLAHAILRLNEPASGQVLFKGKDLTAMNRKELKAARRNIQAVFQDPLASLSPRRSVMQTLMEPLDHFRAGASADRRDRALSALEMVGLDPGLARRLPRELSGGERQRVAIARSLVTEPELIIADEPVSSLDVSVQARIIELILSLREDLGIAFLFVSHDLSVVRRVADSVGVMYLGKIVESAPARQLFADPAHPYTRALLDAVPVADPAHAPPAVLAGEPPSPLTPPAGCVFHRRCPDLMVRCSSFEPGEAFICGPSEPDTDARGLKTGPHRVRCHLWKPAND